MTTELSRRAALAGAAGIAVAAALPRSAAALDPIILNDASRLNPTPVAKNWVVRSTIDDGVIASLRDELRDAASARRPVSIGVARHSMGGQSLARLGTAFSFDHAACIPDQTAGTYRVQAGTRWRDVIAALDPIGFSPAVMQSNNDFGVASTFSVNAHGWAVPHGPFGSTVRSLRLLLADGSVVTCSRQENAELFGLAMGGYGLFGIILDLDVEMVPNALLTPSFQVLPSTDFADQFLRTCTDPTVVMAYGRLDVTERHYLEQSLIGSYRKLPTPEHGLPKLGTVGMMSALTRKVYRAQLGSETAKRLRWFSETVLGPEAAGSVTRNTLLNEPVSALASSDKSRTDILHEYFLPPERLADFFTACRDVILKSKQELLNVTLRYVAADADSVLAHSPATRIAAVMSFPQLTTAEADADMQHMTRELIDRVLAIGGSFYLPYRLHARRDQVTSAYPRVPEFVAAKRRYDPGLLFRHGMWEAWLSDF